MNVFSKECSYHGEMEEGVIIFEMETLRVYLESDPQR